MQRPFSQAAENNKGPIAEILAHYLDHGDLLEIGSGTGQHAVWMAPRFPAVRWHPSEQPENMTGLNRWLEAHPCPSLQAATILRVQGRWPEHRFRHIYTANTFHILSRPLVERCVQRLCEHLTPQARAYIYGPFNYQGHYTSDSNRRFDLHLKSQSLSMGIRDQEWVAALFARHGRVLLADHAMPANNRLLVFH
ncbi:DUF938 domain-containing protein [Alloalcanivorax xenomutans]|jgi:cyclopropane fatty-acyl-phospholipid synthase-like methyltransferase|uniref:Class I SAM-dependent methyltransferase n=1 Tax=Alloalcanivorax xenomutans TaxID=1094342 RepID=A0A9Q3W5L8_9GAMM|nr:DUF938 domain-containing protein [Alloalcanivorax xenomutans]ERS12951.1 methylase [Alcanivorax sp. PN-3]ARB44916.1 methylase [Alloalcanivorax xenomutans]MCE7508984.1 class I SAM-dependent methyltransferase [Alloalcanivorax xenomutans]MCE7522239.1 class I SAM-dependent methyltransferase [Alloalcanivorax xenomutans]WOD29504.1 DUF938 domain-containing protein [Alloalcanivorax xenomutans]